MRFRFLRRSSRTPARARWHRAPFEQALVITAVVAVYGGLFSASYGLALGRPEPHHIPTDLVGNVESAMPAVRQLEQLTGAGLTLRSVASETVARRDIDQQRAYAALILGRRSWILVAGAAGASVARVIEQAAEKVDTAGAGGLTVTDVRPLPRNDPNGLVAFYATLAATIVSFVAMFQLRANADGLTLGQWRTFIAIIAILTGVTIALATGPVIGSLRGSLLEKMGILALESAVAASVCSLLLILLDRWAIAVNWVLFVVLGNASSGGAVAPPLLPPFYAAISRWLPPGACVEALRTAVYFPDAQHPEPFVMLGVWLLAAQGGGLLASRTTGRLPTGKQRKSHASKPGLIGGQ